MREDVYKTKGQSPPKLTLFETLVGRFRRAAGSRAMGAWVPSCLARNWLN